MDDKNSKFSFKQVLLKGMTELCVICLGIIFFFIIFKSDKIFAFLGKICSILLPVIMGLAIAYLINPLVKFFENLYIGLYTAYQTNKKHREKAWINREKVDVSKSHVWEYTGQAVKYDQESVGHENHDPESEEHNLSIPESLANVGEKLSEIHDQATAMLPKKEKPKKTFSARMPAILTSLILLGVVIYVLAYLVVPQLYINIRSLVKTLPNQLNALYIEISKLVAGNEQINGMMDSAYNQAMSFVTNWMKQDMVGQVGVIISGVLGAVSAIVNIVVSLIVAIYVLASKETFMRQGKMVLRAFFKEKHVKMIINVLKESDRIFGGFITGKLIDSLIIGIICFFGICVIYRPYAPLISVIIGVTNIIPFFGPYIGAVPSAFLILLVKPSKGLIFILFILILQQFDGNILGPKILGQSTGLSPFWVIFAILLGSGLFGIMGMIIGVPVFGVIYYLGKSFIHYKLDKKEEAETEQEL